VLDRYVLVLHAVGLPLSGGEHPFKIARYINGSRLPAGSGHVRQPLRRPDGVGFELRNGNAHFEQQLRDQTLFLCEQRRQQMLLLELHVLVFHRAVLRFLYSLQGFLRKFLCVHKLHSFPAGVHAPPRGTLCPSFSVSIPGKYEQFISYL